MTTTPNSVILAAIDLEPHRQVVVERAARQALALGNGAVVEVLVCGDTPRARAEAVVAALEPALRAVVRGARVAAGDDAADVIVREAGGLGAGLVVVGASRRSFLDQVFRGSTTVALTRRSPLPLLVARREPVEDYRQALIAVDTDRPVEPLARTVRALLGPVPAELFTVVDDAVRLQMIAAEADPAVLRDHQRDCVQTAYTVLTKAAGAVAEVGWAPRARVAEGVPSREIRARVDSGGADILVLQPEAKGAFMRALVGSLTEEILARQQDCDLLILPAARD